MTEKLIFTTTDPEGRTVHLRKESLLHITGKHLEVRTSAQIKSTIQKPDFINEISTRSSLVYIKIKSTSLYFNVYSKMDDTYKEGYVSTAHITTKPPQGETIWYRKI